MTCTDRYSWRIMTNTHDICWEVLITYWKYSWHVLMFTYDTLRRALDILTGNHDLYWQVVMTYTDRYSWSTLTGTHDVYWQVLMTYTDRNSWHFLIRSRDLVTCTHAVYGEVLMTYTTLHTEKFSWYSDRYSWRILTGTNTETYSWHIVMYSWHEALFNGRHVWTRPEISGSVKYGKLPRLAKQTSGSQEGLHEMWGNQDAIVWCHVGV
jgi:hypothetical protein